MGYHHDHDWNQDRVAGLFDRAGIRRGQIHELQPLEVRRMLWEGATLVQPKHPLSDPLQSAIQLEADMEERQIRDMLPDSTMPLLCMGIGKDGAASKPAVQLAEHLLSLGYGHVFCLASGSPELSIEVS
ncbi:hypothetical protein [Synechococcus sp. 1G10]|uniref:hypothetical protein n=1 Tax=Synechococcus sp. 1G10 TaxID=2025605 RepID=UPI000B998E67|nr:hypothetical protein [Synechococcus sp. 1G10]